MELVVLRAASFAAPNKNLPIFHIKIIQMRVKAMGKLAGRYLQQIMQPYAT